MCRYGYLGDRDEHTLNLGEILGRLRRYRELTLSNLVLLVSLPISQGHWRTAIVWTREGKLTTSVGLKLSLLGHWRTAII